MLCISLQSLSLDNPAHWLLCLSVLFPSHYLLILVLKFLDLRNSPRSVLIHLYTSTKSGETNVGGFPEIRVYVSRHSLEANQQLSLIHTRLQCTQAWDLSKRRLQ